MGGGRPHSGDIILHRQVHSPAVYVLSRRDGPLRCSYKTYEQALAQAIESTRREHLDAWYTTDGQVFERLARHRPIGSGREEWRHARDV